MNREYVKRMEKADDAADQFFQKVHASGNMDLLDEDSEIVDLYLEAFDVITDASEEELDFYTRMSDYYHFHYLCKLNAGIFQKEVGGKKTLAPRDLAPVYEVLTQYLDTGIEQNDRFKSEYIARKADLISEFNSELEQCGFTLSKGGCYIATAVYGSYDCPQVWMLRRYRDLRLANRLWGRLFIRAYYAASPALVERFGEREWFGRLFRRPLDAFVRRLQAQGYADTPYDELMAAAEAAAERGCNNG